MRSLSARLRIGSLLCLGAAVAQEYVRHPWRDLKSKNPAGVELSIRLIKPTKYRERELIRAEIRFPARSLPPAGVPAREHWQFAGFLLDPVSECGSLAKPCVGSVSLHFGQSEPILRLGQELDPVQIFLNRYLPALIPGRYRTQAVKVARHRAAA